MKIRIKSEDGTRFRFWFPACVFSWKWVWKLAFKKIEMDIDKAAIKKIYKEFRKIKKHFKGLEIVHVESSDGDLVSICF